MKRYTERISDNKYATNNSIIKELNIDDNNEDEDYILEQQKNIIDTLDQKLGKLEDLEEELGCPLDEAIDLLLKAFSKTDDYRCLTCINSMRGTHYGCDGSCQHKDSYTKKEIINLIRTKTREG